MANWLMRLNWSILNEISLRYIFGVQVTIITGSDNVLVQNRRQAIIWTNDGIVCWRMYASLGLDGLK